VTLAALVREPPSWGSGQPIGLGDWRLVVEIVMPDNPGSIYGTATYGSSEYTDPAWVDVTDWVRGLEWTRGADEPFGRPRIGELSVTLDDRGGIFSPWSTSTTIGPSVRMAPGAVIRVGCISRDYDVTVEHTGPSWLAWLPQFCGIVDSWTTGLVGNNLPDEVSPSTTGDRWVTIRAYETLRAVSEIDANALPGVVGYGETVPVRIQRLLDAANWQFGEVLDDARSLRATTIDYRLQSTDMADNRLAECYLTADSAGVVVRTDRTGRVIVCDPGDMAPFRVADLTAFEATPGVWPLLDLSWCDRMAQYGEPWLVSSLSPSLDYAGTTRQPAIGFDWREWVGDDDTFFPIFGVRFVPYDRDTVEIANDDSSIINDARLAVVGGTQQVQVDDESTWRFGRKSLARGDLLGVDDGSALAVAERVVRDRSSSALRWERMDISTSDRGESVWLMMLAVDVGVAAFAFPPDGAEGYLGRRLAFGRVRSFTHRVTPRVAGARVTWQTSVSMDTTQTVQ